MPTDNPAQQELMPLREVEASQKPIKKSGGRRHKQKGDAFERELAEHMNAIIFPDSPVKRIHRTPLSGAFSVHKGVGSADLTGTPELWVEAKRVERLNFHDAMAQAVRGSKACGEVDMPVVINRRSRQTLDEAVVTIRLKDFMRIYHAFLKANGYASNQ